MAARLLLAVLAAVVVGKQALETLAVQPLLAVKAIQAVRLIRVQTIKAAAAAAEVVQ
jgi:hypothetical protein